MVRRIARAPGRDHGLLIRAAQHIPVAFAGAESSRIRAPVTVVIARYWHIGRQAPMFDGKRRRHCCV